MSDCFEVFISVCTLCASHGESSRIFRKMNVLSDIERGMFNIAPTIIEVAVGENSKVIIPMHLFGQMADMDPVMEIIVRDGLYVIEDGAQATGRLAS